MNQPETHELDTLFYPKNIAVVGVSRKNGMRATGHGFVKGAIEMNFRGQIFPVHPEGQDTLGFKTYPSVRDIPEEIDLVIFAVPAAHALSVMEDCVAKGVKFAHLFTAGFSETGIEEYAELEKKILETARKGGVRVVGPNCMGLYCPEGGLSFQPFFPPEPGPVGYFSQSGQLTGFFVMKGAALGLRFSKAISFGNAGDLKHHDFLNYLARDDKTEVIGSYIEGLKDGRSFFEAAREVTRKKPLVIYKGGQTEGGSRATQSHTAAIAGSMKIWQALCRQTGIIPVNSMDELVHTIAGLQRLPLPKSSSVAIMGGAGGGSVTMTDIAEKAGLNVPRLSEDTIRKLREFVPVQGSSVQNPLDVGMNAYFGENFQKLIELMNDDPKIDALIFTQNVGMFNRMLGRSMINIMVNMTLEANNMLKKPLFIVLEKDDAFGPDDGLAQFAIDAYQGAGLAVFPSFEMASMVMNSMCEYKKFLDSPA